MNFAPLKLRQAQFRRSGSDLITRGPALCMHSPQAVFSGGNVRYEQWRKYNKVRAIENHCYTLVTMGRDDIRDNNYVFGFNREGGELSYYALHDTVQSSNVPGTVYVYDLAQDTGIGDTDTRLNQKETECQYQLIRIPVGKSEKLLRESKRLREHLYIKSYEDMNLVIVVADNQNILLPENHLPLLYDTTLKAYRDKRYLILCRYDNLDEKLKSIGAVIWRETIKD